MVFAEEQSNKTKVYEMKALHKCYRVSVCHDFTAAYTYIRNLS